MLTEAVVFKLAHSKSPIYMPDEQLPVLGEL
jgi:hypothetical protein